MYNLQQTPLYFLCGYTFVYIYALWLLYILCCKLINI